MKILYIASERSRAQVATRALRTISPSVTVLWGSSYERAAFGILENPDLTALIVEVQSDRQGCSYLKQLHTLGVQAPVVMVLPEGAASPVESLKAGADYYVAKGPAFSQELPAVVSRAIGREQASVESAFEVHADPRLRENFAQTREPERRISHVDTSMGEREQRRAVEPSAAGHLEKLEMLLRQERESRNGLEQKLAEARAALQDTEQRHVSATAVAAAQLAERTTQHESGMARATATQKMLEEQLRQSRQSRASAFADVERLTLRNAELSSKLTEVTATGNVLERRLAEIEAVLQAANERASSHQLGAAQQAAESQAQLQALVEQEVEKRRNLEDELARAKRAHEEAEKQRSSVVSAASALWTERQAQFDAELATAAEARNTLGREARELGAALDQSRQAVQAHAASVERLTRREAELTLQLADATAIRSTLERQLADAADKLKDANDGASRNRLTAATKAAERELEWDGLIRHERTVRADVEQRLAQVEEALREAEQKHASAVAAAAADVERLTQREAAFGSQLAEASALRSTLERQLTDAANAVKDAKDGARRDLFAGETRAAERQVEFDRLIQQERAARADVEQRLARAEAALREAEQTHASAMTAAATDVERRTQRETELTSQLAQAAAMRNRLERQLTDQAAALKDANEGAARDRVAAETKAAERVVEFERLIERERATRGDVEQRLAQVEVALRQAEQQHASTITAATTERAERQARFDSELAQTAATRDEFKRRFSDAETALAAARHDHATAAAEVERLTQRGTELTSQLAQIQAALRTSEEQHASAMTAAATARAERQAQFESELSQTAATRDEFERRLNDTETALAAARHDHTTAATEVDRLTQRETELTSQLAQIEAALRKVEQQHASAMTTAATDRAERQAQFERELLQTAATRDDFKRRFSDAETALAAARHDHASAATEVARLTQRETTLTSQLAEAAAMRKTLERQLTEAATAFKDAEESAGREIGHERARRGDVEQRLSQVEASLREAKEQHASAMKAAAADRAERQERFERELSQTAAARDEFKRRFNDAETALAAARHDHWSAATEVERLTQRESELTSQLTEGAAMRHDVEQRLGQVEASLREAEELHASAMTAAATERAARQAQFERELSQTAATRDEFKRRFSDAETALAAVRHDHASAATEVERLTQCEADLTSQLAEGAAMRADVEHRLSQVEASLREAEEQHASAMRAAAADRAERQERFERELSQTAATRDEFKRRCSDTETALAAARHDHASAATEVERLTQREAELTSQLADAAATRSTLEQQLATAATALRDANDVANRDRLAAETRAAEREAEFDRLITNERAGRADVEQRLAQEVAHHEALDRKVAEMHSAAADAEQRFREEIATLTARARHQVTQLESDFAREREAHKERQVRLLNDIQNLEAARGALDESLTSMREQRDGLERARVAAESEVQRLAAELTEARQNLDEGRRNFQQTLDLVSSEHADAQAKLVATVAERDARIEDVEKQLEESGLELRRQFLRAPVALWRCSREGALTHANKALADLTGYRQPDELRSADFVNTVFESTDDLSWLIERCLSTKTRQSVDTDWKRKTGEHLVVRLSAIEFAPDTIEIAVEEITSVRVLEERLAQAHRMEAVARLASEIAITCGRLLGDVHHDGQQWVMEVSDDTAVRKRGERLLGEVARAASYLARLAAHGDEQTNALKAVDLNRVLRDLKPVLKHVAGDDVELDLSKTSSALNVDMKADRVERLLVNLASYGRERMPSGGRLKIELATVVVDQKFIADHPNVKRGHHALITVTTVRRDTPTAEMPSHTGATDSTANDVVSEKPGVDLGALQELLQECGGHLWLTVDPPGNMVVKIRLPLRVWDDRPQPTTSDPPTSRKRGMPDPPTSHKRAMGRWFRH